MSATSQDISPTDTAASSLRDQRESSLNGFTAVNGRGSPPQSGRASDSAMSGRPMTSDGPVRPHGREDQYAPATNGDGYHRSNHHDSRQSVSPMNVHVKRKRPITDGEDEADDEEDESASPEDLTENMDYEQRGDETPRDPTYAQLAEALRHEPHTNGHSRPDSDGGDRSLPPSDRNEYVTTSANVQVDPKKRKRAFTNRTKTGCQTCRKRKKKCDEGKPTCNNCERGGFVCEGYTQRTAFPRTSAPKQHPTPIQSKDSFADHGTIQPRTRPNPFVDVPSHIGPDGARRAPQQAIVIDDDLSSRAVSSEWGQPPIYGAGPTSRYGMNRYTSDALPGPFRGHLDRASSSSTVSGGVNGLHYDVHQSPMAIARQGLEQMPGAAKAAPRTSFQSEKEKMRHGEEFNLLDGGLAREREACRASLHRFNASAATGISPDERERQLRTILEPEGAVHAGGAAGAPGSRLGKNVVVDAPFRCDYGFSINIRDGVWIEAGCVIADAAEVKICEGAHIGPDVKIVSRAEPWDPRLWLEERPGAPPLRRARGIRIVIEERVKIGAGAVIAPEWDPKIGDDAGLLRIGMNSRILAGTVVTKDVPANVVYGCKGRDGPDVLCGIYGPSSYQYHTSGHAMPAGSAL